VKRVAPTLVALAVWSTAGAAPPRFSPSGPAASPGARPTSVQPPTAAKTTIEETHEAEHEGTHPHHFAVLLGATTVHGETHPTVGADYIYWLPVLDRRLGLSPLVDLVLGEPRELLFGLGVAMRAPWGLRLTLAPVLALADGHRAWGGRVNVGYDLHFGHFSVGPVLDADLFAENTAYVYGLAVGYGF